MTAPSVKGVIILPSVVQVRRARDRGRISAEVLRDRLSPGTAELLDQRIQSSKWYPMEHFSELLDLDWEVSGRRDPDYMREMGMVSAKMMFEKHRYQQLEYIQRAEKPRSRADILRQMRLTSTITLSHYNYLEIEVRFASDRPNLLQVVYSNAGPFPEACRYSTEGFMTYLNRERGSARRWTSERPSPDRILFSLELKPRDD